MSTELRLMSPLVCARPLTLLHFGDQQLDLSLSMPYTVVAMRDSIVLYLAALEEKAKAVASRLRAHEEGEEADGTPALSSASHDMLATFQSQLSVIRNDLKRIVLLFPAPPQAALGQSLASFPSPISTFTASQAALAARSQSLAADWERLASALGSRLPAGPSGLFAAMHTQFDTLHETMATMSLRDFWEERKQLQWPSGRMGEVSSSLVESILESTSKGRERAGSILDSMLELERAAYARACELAKGGRLITYEELPHLWRNNEHILTGYRFIPLNEPLSLLKSAVTIHNETLNIHTHLIGIAFILPLFWASHDADATTMDRVIRSAYLGSAMKCLILSVAWHICSGSSNLSLFNRSACADYSGVAVLIAATVISTVYAEFFCQPRLALLYSVTTGLVGLAGAVLPWQTWFNKRENKGKRIAMFLGICFTSLLPFFHASYKHGLIRTFVFLSPIIPSLLAYIGGLVIYATNCPESLLPGKFDLWGHSHQWWHCAILLAIALHWKAMEGFRQGRVEYSCQAL